MKKVFGQTVRDIKKGVNKKVLKVPKIEQKVLDATSNESWGPHGSLLADIAQSSRNYHEYQMIMGILWKRLSDTGKNWRHVYKGLTVLEYLVAHGSERVIDEIRERAYQISTLSDFQYIDSSGRDQGSNVRKKSHSLVVLVNDKERIIEIREKAAANREKFRSPAAGGMHRPGSNSDMGGYGDSYDYEGRYGSKDDDRNGYGRERDHEYRDADRYSREGDRYSRDSEDRYDRDGYRDDDSRGRSRSVDAYQHGSRGRSSDRDRTFDDDGQSSSRASTVKADDHVQDGRGLERKSSEQNISAPPSYEETVSESRSPVYSERDREETPQVSATGVSPPNNSKKGTNGVASEPSPSHQESMVFDEFDPRGAVSADHPTSEPAVVAATTGPAAAASTITSVPPPAHNTSNNFEMDLLGSLSDPFAPTPLAIMPAHSASVESNTQVNFGPVPPFSATETSTQPFDDPFGDGPFKAVTSTGPNQIPQQTHAAPFNLTPPSQTAEVIQPAALESDSADNFGFGDTFYSNLNPTSSVSGAHHTSNTEFSPQEQSNSSLQDDFDILAGILPPSGPPASLPPVPVSTSQVSVDQPAQTQNWPSQMQSGQPPQIPFGQPGFAQAEQTPLGQPGHTPFGQAEQAPFGQTGQTPFGEAGQSFNMASHSQNLTGPLPFGNGSFVQQQSSEGPVSSQNSQYTPGMASQPYSSGNFLSLNAPTSQIHQYTPNGPPLPQPAACNSLQQQTSSVPMAPHTPTQQTPSMHLQQQNNNIPGNLFSPTAPSTLVSSGLLSTVPQTTKDKFETKSTVWADTLSRGLVNLNISGPKTNPLSDIGVDFDAINRKDKRLEKPAATPVTSTITMGKAMGSGSGMGRAGAGALRPPPNSMAGSGLSMGGGYGGMNQQQPMGMGMGMNQQQPMGVGMGMNMGMGQGYPVQQQQLQPGMNPGSAMPGGYNPMMGSGGYNPHQPYGGYR